MGNVGIPELIIFAVILLLLFGAKRIPDIARSVGTGMREFKEGITDSGEPEPPIEAEVPAVTPSAPSEQANAERPREAERANP
jgi:sec-independent protein translocase protein TatA